MKPRSTRLPDGELELQPYEKQLALRLHESREEHELACLKNRLLLAELGFTLPDLRRRR